MHVLMTATFQDFERRDNFCERLERLEVKPKANKEQVKLDCEVPNDIADQICELFEKQPRHDINFSF